MQSCPITPYERWIDLKLDLSNLIKWGFIHHVKILDPKQDELDGRSITCAFIGYPKDSKGCRFYSPLGGIIESRDIYFVKKLTDERINQLIDQLSNEPIDIVEDDLIFIEQSHNESTKR